MDIYEQRPLHAAFDLEAASLIATGAALAGKGLTLYWNAPRASVPEAVEAALPCAMLKPVRRSDLMVAKGDRVLLEVYFGHPREDVVVDTALAHGYARVSVDFGYLDAHSAADLAQQVMNPLRLILIGLRRGAMEPGVPLPPLEPMPSEGPVSEALRREHLVAPYRDSDRLTGLVPTRFGRQRDLAARFDRVATGMARASVCCPPGGFERALAFDPPRRLPQRMPLEARLSALKSHDLIDHDGGRLARDIARMPLEQYCSDYKNLYRDLLNQLPPSEEPSRTVGDAARALRDACVAGEGKLPANHTEAVVMLSLPLFNMRMEVRP